MEKTRFRVWDKKERKLLNVSLIDFETGVIYGAKSSDGTFRKSYVKDPTNYGEGWGSVKDVVLEQYIGLDDKNGAGIFEGDVVRCVEGEYYNGVWEYDYTIIVTDIRSVYGGLLYCCFQEIIGNIHENPELLEVIG